MSHKTKRFSSLNLIFSNHTNISTQFKYSRYYSRLSLVSQSELKTCSTLVSILLHEIYGKESSQKICGETSV